jgi:pilus assembly protein TadC
MLTSLSGWSCAGFAALAVFWALRSPADGLRRAAVDDALAPRQRWPAARILAGRPDAPALARRFGVSALFGASACLVAIRFQNGPGMLSWLALPPLVLIGTVGLGWLEPLSARRRQQQLVSQAPQALELLAACLAAGLPIRTAAKAVVAAFDGPVAQDLGRVLAVSELGVSDAEAWRALQGHPQFGPAAVDLARSVESGTMMVTSLRHHAEVARERRRAACQVRARAVGVRSVLPLMTCFIPSFMLLGVVPTVVSAVTHALS